MTVYFISGLGVDHRVFKKLALPDSWIIKYIEWFEPSQNETLLTYSNKVAKLIDTTQEFAIVGLSFGGIVAVELTKILVPTLTIIISSVSTRMELPTIYKVAGFLKLDKIIPASILKSVSNLTYWLFGAESAEEKLLLKQIISDTSPKFIKWAIPQILNWANTTRPENIFHIHGKKDRVLPCNKTLADVKLDGCGHFMVYSDADEISRLLITKLGNR